MADDLGAGEIPEQMPIEVRISDDNSPRRCITIPSVDQKKVVHNIVVFLNKESSVPEIDRSIDHHKNVSMDTLPVEVLHGSMKCSSLDIYQETLKQLISSGKELSEDFVKTLLLQITRGLAHLHDRGQTFGQMKPDHIYISCNKNNAVLTNVWMNSAENHAHCKADDIVYLGKLFQFVLSGTEECSSSNTPALKCTEKLLANDLIERMLGKKSTPEEEILTAEAIQKHPFFWSNSEKITFLCDAHDSIKHLEKDEDLEKRGKTEVFEGDWFKNLKLRKEEATAIKETSRKMTGKAKQISHDTILNSARGIKKNRKVSFTTYLFDECNGHLAEVSNILAKEWGGFVTKLRSSKPISMDDPKTKKRVEEAVEKIARKSEDAEYQVFDRVILVKDCEEQLGNDSFYDLLRFFRNRKAHYCESNQNIQRCFQSYPNGFWKFFSSRYPNLLPFVYENRRKFKLIKDAREGGGDCQPIAN